jgi:hypothetical protein
MYVDDSRTSDPQVISECPLDTRMPHARVVVDPRVIAMHTVHGDAIDLVTDDLHGAPGAALPPHQVAEIMLRTSLALRWKLMDEMNDVWPHWDRPRPRKAAPSTP